MFDRASAFNRDISKWNLKDGVITTNMFIGAGLFSQKWCSKGWDDGKVSGATLGNDGLFKCCPAGQRHIITSTAIECQTCLVGTFTTTRYKTSCTKCPRGWYQSEEGTQYCIPCVPGNSGFTRTL